MYIQANEQLPRGAVPPELHPALRWRFVGPYRGGRVMAVAGHPTEPMVFWFGTSGGGVWKTDDGGTTWRNVSDGYFKRASVGALAVADADPTVLYVGLGECGLRSNTTHGDGVYRSEDGGASWQHRGLAPTQNIARVRVHPRDPDLLYVAAFGHRFGPNAERGVYRSRDGGKHWEQILYRGEGAGAIDLTLDTANPRVMYAAFWRAQLSPWVDTIRGPGSGLFRSTDGGDSWTELTERPGFPSGPLGRIGITASPVRPGRLWALIDAPEGGIYRSDDGGDSWTWLNDNRNFLVRPWYFGHIVADPQNADTVHVPGRKLWRSVDGGRTYRQVNVPYVDQHDLWIDPRNTRRMILGNDGGGAVSFNGGETWSSLVNQPTAEIYRTAADNHFPYRIYGSQQDNSTLCLPSRSDRGPVTQFDWYDVGGGESGFIAVRPDDPDIVYSSDLPGLGVTRYDHRTHQLREIAPWAEPGSGEGGKLRYRFNWSVPVVVSPHPPHALYIAANQVFRSTDEGSSWSVISPDLTRDAEAKIAAPDEHGSSGENDAVHYCTISSFAESAVQPGVLWAGSDDGLIHLSRDNGASWADVTPDGLPAWSTTQVEASPHQPGCAYVAATNHMLDDFRPYIFRTNDYGASWEAIVEGIPSDEFVRVVREDPARRGLLYCGTEVGVHVSLDDGAAWMPLRLNLPAVAIHDMLCKDGDLVIATHGRGLWILDDLSPLHQLSMPALAAPAHVFAPRPVYRVTRQAYGLDSLLALYAPFAADNPPAGVVVTYLLREPAGEVVLELLDGAGTVVSAASSTAEPLPPHAPIGPLAYQLFGGAAMLTGTVAGETEPGVRWGPLTLSTESWSHAVADRGLHRVQLNITYPGALRIPGAPSYGITAPLAAPGSYTVRLTVDGNTYSQPVEIVKDPRVATTQQQFEEQLALMLRIRDKVSSINRGVVRIRDLREQLAACVRLMSGRPDAQAALEYAAGLQAALWSIENELIQPGLNARSGELDSGQFPVKLNNQLEAAGYHVARSDDAPTSQSYELVDDLSRRADEYLARLDALLVGEVQAFNTLLRDGGLAALAPLDR